MHRKTHDPVPEHTQMSNMSQQKIRVLDAFEARTDDWTYGDFERALEESMGARYRNYQDGKMTIIEANREGHWPKTVERWIRSNHKAFGNLPSEMNPIGAKFDLSK